ncbi:MAG: hypothetical protein AAF328_05050 [Planctomycetota bacterium]
MPVVLFTLHAYGSWMPDRPEGYVRRREGLLPTAPAMADQYRKHMKANAVSFDAPQQRLVLEATLEKCVIRGWTLQAAATDPTHIHAVLSWHNDTPAAKIQDGLKRSITIACNARHSQRPWLSEGGSKKRVANFEHLTHLRENYLPSHRGWRYDAETDWTPPKSVPKP